MAKQNPPSLAFVLPRRTIHVLAQRRKSRVFFEMNLACNVASLAIELFSHGLALKT